MRIVKADLLDDDEDGQLDEDLVEGRQNVDGPQEVAPLHQVEADDRHRQRHKQLIEQDLFESLRKAVAGTDARQREMRLG